LTELETTYVSNSLNLALGRILDIPIASRKGMFDILVVEVKLFVDLRFWSR